MSTIDAITKKLKNNPQVQLIEKQKNVLNKSVYYTSIKKYFLTKIAKFLLLLVKQYYKSISQNLLLVQLVDITHKAHSF